MRAKYHYLQSLAHKMVRYAVEHGDLVRPECCDECHKVDDLIEAHHHDYSHPLEVVWLCRSCHLKAHGKRLAIHRKVSDAAEIVRQHFENHPEDMRLKSRLLAGMLGVGKSTVNNVQRDMKSKTLLNGHSNNEYRQ